jgi:hypothetical protein
MKTSTNKKKITAHTSTSQRGLGNFYGTGIVAKIGKMRSGMGFQQLPPTKLRKPPRSVA